MGERENQFLRQAFRSYYNANPVKPVPETWQREFGIGDFGKKIVRRHMAFSGEKELNDYLKQETPPFISYSAAYYERPNARPMDRKGFLGADLIYEFDADDIPTKCKEEHDFWECKNAECGEKGKGGVRECPKCGSGTKQEQWFCGECLEETKKQTLRLIEVLSSELGFKEGISVNFSGKAGYHVHVRGGKAKALSRNARNELIDYLTLNGFDLEAHGFGRIFSQGLSKKSAILKCPVPSQSRGIASRFMKRLISFIKGWNAEKLAVHGNLSRKQSSFLLKNRDSILAKMEEGVLFPIPAVKPETSQNFWKLLIEEAMMEESLALDIDRQTSVDVHKILRLPDSIHGGTGLVAKSLSLEELLKFDPFRDAAALSGGPIRVFINKAPEFSLGGEKFGASSMEEKELPLNAAVLLLASGRAELR